jgi:hypothetical protein
MPLRLALGSMKRLTSPVLRGASPLLLFFVALTVAGLVLQLYSGGVSSIDGAVWMLALLTAALIVTARARSGDRPGLLSRISIPLLGVYVAGQVAYSIAFGHRYLATLGWQSLLPILVLGALVAAGSIQDAGKRKHSGQVTPG